MTRREAERLTHQADTLRLLGFTRDEAEQLRRISMTLQRWFELECGNSNEYGSWAIERDGDDGDGLPYMVHHHYRHGHGKDSVTRTRVADRERGALKRLQLIVAARNARVIADNPDWQAYSDQPIFGQMAYYIQGDPRGCALHIIRPGDVPDGKDVGAYYTRGIAVY